MLSSPSKDQEIKKPEPKKSENELQWEELIKNMTRPLILCDLDFTDLQLEDDKDDLAPRGLGGSVPPPPPPIGIAPPPMLKPIPPPVNHFPLMNYNCKQPNNDKNEVNGNSNQIKKNKKTVSHFHQKKLNQRLIKNSFIKICR